MKTSFISPKTYLNMGYYFNSKCTHPAIEYNIFDHDDYIESFPCHCLICRKEIRNTDIIEKNPFILRTVFNIGFDDKVIVYKYIESICSRFINNKEIDIVKILNGLSIDIEKSIDELHVIIRNNKEDIDNITKNKILTK